MTVTCFHVFTKLQGIQEAPLPLLSSDTLWVHSEELKTSLSKSFHLGSQLNWKDQDKSICPRQILFRPHLFTKILNELIISHPNPLFFQSKTYMELMTLKQGCESTSKDVFKTLHSSSHCKSHRPLLS